MPSPSGSPFTTCIKGHDLTNQGAFLYDARGHRICRECAVEQKKSSGSRKRGSFA